VKGEKGAKGAKAITASLVFEANSTLKRVGFIEGGEFSLVLVLSSYWY